MGNSNISKTSKKILLSVGCFPIYFIMFVTQYKDVNIFTSVNTQNSKAVERVQRPHSPQGHSVQGLCQSNHTGLCAAMHLHWKRNLKPEAASSAIYTSLNKTHFLKCLRVKSVTLDWHWQMNQFQIVCKQLQISPGKNKITSVFKRKDCKVWSDNHTLCSDLNKH